ncbi:hypothetical protein ACQCSX_23110 (plasmid) [Pseudarthrobacter sp. P1]|uniref:hypothetical protein n=1 Tax=Pseudarthrobacter sp. P1 TaxID=3418418 RepID=UPI003CF0AF68
MAKLWSEPWALLAERRGKVILQYKAPVAAHYSIEGYVTTVGEDEKGAWVTVRGEQYREHSWDIFIL